MQLKRAKIEVRGIELPKMAIGLLLGHYQKTRALQSNARISSQLHPNMIRPQVLRVRISIENKKTRYSKSNTLKQPNVIYIFYDL